MAELVLTCPLCFKPKLYFNPDKQVGYCHRCQASFTQRDLGGRIREARREVPVAPNVWLEPASLHPPALEYLQRRGVENPEGILYAPEDRRLYFRIWAPSPEYAPSWHTRGIDTYRGWRVFPGTNKRHYVYGSPQKTMKRVLVVEGIFDALRIGPGCISLLGSTLYPTHQCYLRLFQEVAVWGDPDVAGKKLSKDTFLQVGSRVKVIEYSKEPGDCLKSNEMVRAVQRWLNESR